MACKIKIKDQNQKDGSHIELFDKESSDHDLDKGEEVIEKVEDKERPHKESEEAEHTKEYGWAQSARNTIKKEELIIIQMIQPLKNWLKSLQLYLTKK